MDPYNKGAEAPPNYWQIQTPVNQQPYSYGAPGPAYPNQGYLSPPTQQPMPSSTTVVVTGMSHPAQQQTVVMAFGNAPTQITCGTCRNTVITTVERGVGGAACCWMICLCLFCWPLFWIPLISDSIRDTEHYCPVCKTHLGTASGNCC
ncbi:lipopolysaccharide-induced tumor necrosis factor-alpha factor homolog [Limulus polyphemus]|uniref:Lipopolysaccharide-induced tumor necrosis factor-alpha factor homolog n=1 Tax=Limulus polyphemus TaxID=6850 RepID=A0ABM1SYN2_LIMPO|nr:lipopolysaccharide-induced tumor necrosis factor-alpha factor homolog [Limulus polyphemus]XP_022248739.1 lipopolysaccharide-induced tumor necrosis factor-alpha factor homolog [Limulus polyphemus]